MKNALLALIVAALAGAAYFALGQFEGEDAPSLTVAGPTVETDPTVDTVSLTADETVSARERVPEPALAVATEPDEGSVAEEERTPWTARGRVLDVNGEPVLGVDVALRVWRPVGDRGPGAIVARTIGDGSFEVALRDDSVELMAVSEDWACITAAVAERRTEGREQIIPVARRLDLGGRVVDERGNGLRRAFVSVSSNGMLRLRNFPHPLESSIQLRWESKSRADGTFEIRGVPALEEWSLVVALNGYEPHSQPLPAASTSDLVIRLAPEADSVAAGEGETLVSGLVVLESGAPVQGATVKVYDVETETDEAGSFELAVKRSVLGRGPLVAAKPGLRPAIVESFGAQLHGENHMPPLYLVLGEAALSIHGRVLWADDKPAKRWEVRLLDPTVIDPHRIPSKSVEDLARPEKEQTKTGKAGEFTIGGLLDRTYVIRAYDSSSLVAIESEAVQAGEQDLVLRIPADAFHDRFEGRVLTHDGVALAGVRVSANLVTSRTSSGFTSIGGVSGRSDEDGVFVIEKVPRRHIYLTASGDDVMTKSIDMDNSVPSKGLEILLYRRIHLRFEWESPGPPPTAMSVEDADGLSLSLLIKTKRSSTSMPRETLDEGRSRVVSVSEAAATLILYQGRVVFERIPLTLAPGEVNVIRR